MLRQARKTVLKTATTGILVTTGLELTTHLPSEGRSSEFYHKFSDDVITPLMMAVTTPEVGHNLAIMAIRKGLAPRHRSNFLESSGKVNLQSCVKENLLFPSCIGLAAGFDKDAVAIDGLMEMGFGFVEIGSVTPKPQPGNPKPRLFRLTEDRGVINRFGFNSAGIDEVEENIKSFRRRCYDSGREKSEPASDKFVLAAYKLKEALSRGIQLIFPPKVEQPPSLLGINLGKNKTSQEECKDYELGIERLGPYADYLVINISSPNTPGLRNLQNSAPLRRLLCAAVEKRNSIPKTYNGKEGKEIPLFVKIAPDLSDNDLNDIASAVQECRIDGILVTNTSNQRPSSLGSRKSDEKGGLSGAPIRELSTECIRKMYRLTGGNVFIVGIGGVGNGHDAYEKLKAGASVVQLYSQMIYEGPGLISRIRRELSELMLQNGQKSLDDVIGLDHEDIFWDKSVARMKEVRERENVIVEE